MVRRPDHAFLLHLLDQLGGPVIPDIQVPLNERRRGLALARHQIDGLVEQALLAVAGTRDAGQQRLLIFVNRFGDVIQIRRLTLP